MATFNTPTQLQSYPDKFWGYYSIPVGISVILIDGHYALVPTPTNDEFEAAGREGWEWFRGGYEYLITDLVAIALTEDGFEVGPNLGYGEGGYGQGPYGGEYL